MSDALTVTNAQQGNRTVLRFRASAPIWNALNTWAAAQGYKEQLGSDGRHKVFQKGTGFLVAPMMLDITVDGDDVTMQAWVRMNLFVRLMSFFILPSEMGIQSGGFRAVVPRNMARKAVNALLTDLGQPLIP